MAGSAVNNTVSKLWYALANVTDGDITGAGSGFEVGYLAEDGTDLSNPEILTEDFFVGSATTGASISGVLRILGNTIPAHPRLSAIMLRSSLNAMFISGKGIMLMSTAVHRWSALCCVASKGTLPVPFTRMQNQVSMHNWP